MPLRRLAPLLLIAALPACMAPPEPLASDSEARLERAPLPYKVALRPLRVALPESDLRLPPEQDSGRSSPDRWEPELSRDELGQLEQAVSGALAVAFGQERVVSLPEDASDGEADREAAALRAETRRAQLLVEAELVGNSISAGGPAFFPSLGEWLAFCFFPLHWGVPNEEFVCERALALRFYDVRDADAPLFEQRLTGRDIRLLSELEHGLVILNTYQWLFGVAEAGERYSPEQWQGVYETLAPHATRALQRELIAACDKPLRARLEEPAVREALEGGDPSKSRLHIFLLGQDVEGVTRAAEADARALELALSRLEAGQRAQLTLIPAPLTVKAVTEALATTPRKAVDRLLFVFSGQGRRERRGDATVEGLQLAGDEVLWLPELAEAVRLWPAREALFILDASFGGKAYRAEGRGRRTAGVSPPARDFLGPLHDARRGWQVLSAAGPDAASGEYEGHGMLTGLLLERLKGPGEVDLSELAPQLGPAMESLSEAWLGRAIRPVALPEEGRRPFVLRFSEG